MSRFITLLLSLGLVLHSVAADTSALRALTVSGTHFFLDGQPFPFTGVSFFNAI